MEVKYLIQDTENKMYLSHLQINCSHYSSMETKFRWMMNPYEAIRFSTAEEANATITFIGDVIDWELEQILEIKEVY